MQALRFELGKVEVAEIRARMVAMLAQVDGTLAGRVAKGLGLEVNQKLQTPLNMSVPADGNVKEYQPKPVKKNVGNSPALSMANTVKDSVKTRKVAILGADGFDDAAVAAMKKALTGAGAQAKARRSAARFFEKLERRRGQSRFQSADGQFGDVRCGLYPRRRKVR